MDAVDVTMDDGVEKGRVAVLIDNEWVGADGEKEGRESSMTADRRVMQSCSTIGVRSRNRDASLNAMSRERNFPCDRGLVKQRPSVDGVD